LFVHVTLCGKAKARGYRLAITHIKGEVKVDRVRAQQGCPTRTLDEVLMMLDREGCE